MFDISSDIVMRISTVAQLILVMRKFTFLYNKYSIKILYQMKVEVTYIISKINMLQQSVHVSQVYILAYSPYFEVMNL